MAGALEPGEYEVSLEDALLQLVDDDADDDGVTNEDELLAGSNPGNAEEAGLSCEPESTMSELPADYEFERAFRRVHVIFCGASPTYQELTAFRTLEDTDAQYDELHVTLQSCLDGTYWRDEAVPRIADPMIRPMADADLSFADFEWDYRLFAYVMTGERDVRDLLLADYHVERDSSGNLVEVQGPIEGSPTSLPFPGTGGQPLQPEHRAGMITTAWFLSLNTARTGLPRITAAQAYRSYLGYDLARDEGILPVSGEPADIDEKGVAERRCAVCHSTLDPLSYAFAFYEGIPANNSGPSFGAYNPARPAEMIPNWGSNQTFLLGEPVESVVEWAQAAVQDDAFKRNIGERLFRVTFDREPEFRERRDLELIWRQLPDDGWSANRLIHRLVDLRAFGA